MRIPTCTPIMATILSTKNRTNICLRITIPLPLRDRWNPHRFDGAWRHRAAHDGHGGAPGPTLCSSRHIAVARRRRPNSRPVPRRHSARRRSRTPPSWRRGRPIGRRHEPCGHIRSPGAARSLGIAGAKPTSQSDRVPDPPPAPPQLWSAAGRARRIAAPPQSHIPRRRPTPPGWRRCAESGAGREPGPAANHSSNEHGSPGIPLGRERPLLRPRGWATPSRPIRAGPVPTAPHPRSRGLPRRTSSRSGTSRPTAARSSRGRARTGAGRPQPRRSEATSRAS